MNVLMSLRKQILLALFCCLISLTALSQQQRPAPSVMLPDAFAGWERSGAAQTGRDPKVIDPAHPAVLNEYGFRDFEQATYTKEDRKLTVKAARFPDASSAYGAFTFYRDPRMQNERIGTMAASANERVMFFRDNLLVEATFDRVTAMSAADLRELAAALPALSGPETSLPSLPQYLPRDKVIANSAKFILGPIAYSALGLPVSAQVIDFSRNPEVLSAKISTDAGSSDMLLMNYPTPQIAIERMKSVEAANPNQPNVTYASKRSGPLVAVITGPISDKDARLVLARVHYEADVTWNENTGLSKRDNIGSIVVAAVTLAIIIFLISIGAGAVFGFGRVFLNRLFPGRFAPRNEETEFTRLNLK